MPRTGSRPLAERPLQDAGRASGVDSPRWFLVALAAMLAPIAVHAHDGAGFVLDDWFLVRNAVFDGVLHVANPDLAAARPGTTVVYGLTFGIFPRSPVGVFVVQSGLLVLAGVLTYLLLRRFVPSLIAALVVAFWAILPNHMSLEVWGSVLVANASLVLLLLGALLLSSTDLGWGRLLSACAVLAAACLTYEATIVLAAVAFVALPWWATRRLQWRPVIAGAVTLSMVALWQVLNWHDVKKVTRPPNMPERVLEGHFGWGIIDQQGLSSVFLLLALVGTLVALARLTFPSWRPVVGAAEWLTLAGWGVILGGSVPFAFYLYEPQGAGDRVNYISALGGAMVLVGLLWMVWRYAPVVGVVLATVLVVGAGMARWERSELWATAAQDVERILRVVASDVDPGCDVVVFGPVRIQEGNVGAFMDSSNVDGAVQVELDSRSVTGRILTDVAAFDAVRPECRVDLREYSELGERGSVS